MFKKILVVLNSFKKSLGNCFVGPGRPGLGHAPGRNGPGPKLNSVPWAVTDRAFEVNGLGRQNPTRADLCIRGANTSRSWFTPSKQKIIIIGAWFKI